MLQGIVTSPPSVNRGLLAREGLSQGRTDWRQRVSELSIPLPVLGIAILTVLLAITLVYYRDSLAHLGTWGYAGILFTELCNSVVIIIPTPSPAYAFSMGAVLNPLLLGLIGGTGAALGELTGYYLGVKGRRVVEGGHLYQRFQALSSGRWMGTALFVFALMPVPFDIAGIWAGSTRYPLFRFFAFVAPGKVIKVTVIAGSGYYGMAWLGTYLN